ncbi:MAG: hypothetical protein ACREXS_08990 [Gammaproteobacteria bacterium]
MKIVSLKKNTVMTASFLIALGHAGIAAAHSQSGSLGSAAGATDVYRVTCSNDGSGAPHHLVTQVRDNSPVKPPLVSVVTTKGGSSTTSTDPVDGNSAYSPEKELNKSSGVYIMDIKKSATGAENYTAQFHCETASDAHTGTSWSQTQNQ